MSYVYPMPLLLVVRMGDMPNFSAGSPARPHCTRPYCWYCLVRLGSLLSILVSLITHARIFCTSPLGRGRVARRSCRLCLNEVLIIRFFGSFDDRLVVGGPGTRNMWQIPAFPLRTASRRPRDVKSTHLAQATTPLLSIIHRCTPSASPPALLSKSL